MAEMMRKPKKDKDEDEKKNKKKPQKKSQKDSLEEKDEETSNQVQKQKEKSKETSEIQQTQESPKSKEIRKQVPKGKKDGEGKEKEKEKEKEKKKKAKNEVQDSIPHSDFSPFPNQSKQKNETPKKEAGVKPKKKETLEQDESEKKNETEASEFPLEYDEDEDSIQEEIKDAYGELNELETNVLEIAENILKLKRYDADIETERIEKMSPLVEELFNKCVAKLTHTRGYSKEEIFETIQNLEKKMWLVTDQRRTKKEIIESELHQEVLEFIRKHPGVHARDPSIEEELGITRNPFLKHIMTLEAFNLVRTVKVGRTLNYFLANVPEIFDDLCVLFKNPLIPSVINAFLEDSGESISAIADSLDVYHGAIQYHIKKLIKKEIVRKEKKDGHNYYYVNRELLKRYNKIFDRPPFDI